jgi:UDPglucose 6-dehydrogenase
VISNVAMIGLGKLGLPVAESMAKMYNVSGYDIIAKQSDKIKIADTLEEACKDAEIIFIAMPTPHDPSYGGQKPISSKIKKDFDYTALEECLRQIEQIVINGVMVVLISTVLPGTYRKLARKFTKIQNLIYNPYLIAMGTVADDFLHPDLAIFGYNEWTHGVGMSDTNRLAKRLVWFYERLWKRRPFIAHGTYEEAECIKIFHNTYISAKVGIANMIGDVAHKIGRTNADAVTNALKHADRIVSPKYMTAGNGDGGPCHPRDNIALSWFAQEIDLGYDIFGDIMRIREQQAENVAHELCSHGRDIVILGKSFKPETHLTDGSASMLIGHYCEQMHKTVHYDGAPSTKQKYTYLLAHNRDYSNYNFNKDSIIVDLYRKHQDDNNTVIHYGNSNR